MNTQAPTVTITKAEHEALLEDKHRLDHLDRCNQILNQRSGTTYGWRFIRSAQINRLIAGEGRDKLDLNDANAVGCHPTGTLSIRKAIDHTRGIIETEIHIDEKAINEKLREWSRAWILDGDLVRCRACNRAIIYSRRHEALLHTADCHQTMAYPWELLTALAPSHPRNP